MQLLVRTEALCPYPIFVRAEDDAHLLGFQIDSSYVLVGLEVDWLQVVFCPMIKLSLQHLDMGGSQSLVDVEGESLLRDGSLGLNLRRHLVDVGEGRLQNLHLK